ncbi:MAG: hypothetical protein KJ607_06910, partial [Bacteroidetes bacterium]|nr:hypothetical protein [Bacteroidota bacterium]
NKLSVVNDSTRSVQNRHSPKNSYLHLANRNSYLKSNIVCYMSSSTKSVANNRYNLTELRRNYQILNSFKNLRENWNGNDAQPFPEHLIEKVIKIISKLEYQPQIFPTGRNSIQLEFENKNGDYLEFEIFPDRIIAFKETRSDEWERIVDEEGILNLAGEFNA